MLHNLLEKPEHHRKKVAYLATFVVGVFVFSAWLMIASFNVRQAYNPFDEEDEEMLAQDFRSTLPSLRQENTVTTELVKNPQEEGEMSEEKETEDEKPFWKKIFK